jgi:hypothetical protein
MPTRRPYLLALVLPLLLSCWFGIGAAWADGIGREVTPGVADADATIDCGGGDGCNQCNKPTSVTYKGDPVVSA